jgi:hypothetical protein
MNVFLLTSEYEKLRYRQKRLENKFNEKMSYDICTVQKMLDDLAKQSKEREDRYYSIGLEVTKEERTKGAVENKHKEEETINTIHKMDSGCYASILMYNSY